jgi:hypothetical protein
MSSISDQLGIDTGIIEWELLSSLGTAKIYRERANQDSPSAQREHLISATNYRIAGANSLLLGSIDNARKHFHNSAFEYLAAGSSYGLLIDNLGYSDNIKNYSNIGSIREETDVFNMWPMLLNISTHFDNRKGPINWDYWNENIVNFRNEPVGLLGLPVNVYINLFKSLALAGNRNNKSNEINIYEEIAAALFPFANAYSLALDRARSDEYHWTQLAMPFHPVEPEMMAVLIGAKYLIPGNNFIEGLMAYLPIGKLPRLIIDYVFRQYERPSEGLGVHDKE